MKKGRRTLKITALIIIISLTIGPFSVFAQNYATQSDFEEDLIQTLVDKDQNTFVDIVVNNPDMARESFRTGLRDIEKSLRAGKSPKDQLLLTVDKICRLIALVFKEKLKDDSLIKEYNAFYKRLKSEMGNNFSKAPGAKADPASTPQAPSTPSTPAAPVKSKNKYDQLIDEQERIYTRGNFKLIKTSGTPRLITELAKRKDYRRFIRLNEVIGRFSDFMGMSDKTIETRKLVIQKVVPLIKDPDLEIKLTMRLANSYYLSLDFTNSAVYFKKVLQLCENRNTDTAYLGRFIAAMNLASIYTRKNKHKLMQEYYDMVLDYEKDLSKISPEYKYDQNDFFLMIFSITRLGEVLADRTDWDKGGGNKEKSGVNKGKLNRYVRLIIHRFDNPSFITNPDDQARMKLLLVYLKAYMAIQDGDIKQSFQYFGKFGTVMKEVPKAANVLEDIKLIIWCIYKFESILHDSIKYLPDKKRKQAFFNAAAKMLTEAIKSAQQVLDTESASEGYIRLAFLYAYYADLSNPTNRKTIETSLMLAHKILTSKIYNPEGLLDYYYIKAFYAFKLGKKEETKQYLMKYIEQLELIVSLSSESPEDKAHTLKQFAFKYNEASEAMIKLNDPRTALEIQERYKATQAVNSIDLSKVKIRNKEMKKNIDDVQSLRSKTSEIEIEIIKEKRKPESYRDEAKIKKLTETLAETKSEFYQKINEIRALNPDYEKLVSVKPANFAKIQKLLPDDTVLVQYTPLAEKLYIFIITKDSFKIRSVDVTKTEVESLVKAFRENIKQTETRFARGERPPEIADWKNPSDGATVKTGRLLTKLYSILVSPIEEDIAPKKVVAIIPTGMLYYMPIHAVAKKDPQKGLRFLIEDKEIVYLTSADLFEVIRVKKRSSKGQNLAFGNPDGSLKSAEEEIKDISKIYPGTKVYVGADATEDKIKNLPSNLNILHLATHGYLNSDNVNESYIMLSGSGEEGKLRQGEIFAIPLENSTLVTLSACSTALGERTPGAEIASLASAFSIAGTPSMLASLWAVSDESTKTLMVEFYTKLKEGKGKSASLREAQLKLLRDPKYAHPFYWAPFILIGDWK